MQIIKLSQINDREAWLDTRLGKITGTKARGVRPLVRGTNRTPMGFWQLLAEKVAVAPDGEPTDARGLRLQEEAMQLFSKKYRLPLDTDPGMWISDDNEDIGYSPDGAEPGDNPTYAAEVKCLATATHLRYVVTDMRRKNDQESYRAIDSIPDGQHYSYREQVIQAFVVNENLQKLYFIFYDDRIALDNYVHHVIVIERQYMRDEIERQRQVQLDVLKEINALVAEMAEINV